MVLLTPVRNARGCWKTLNSTLQSRAGASQAPAQSIVHLGQVGSGRMYKPRTALAFLRSRLAAPFTASVMIGFSRVFCAGGC